jgi:hypothetical protein
MAIEQEIEIDFKVEKDVLNTEIISETVFSPNKKQDNFAIPIIAANILFDDLDHYFPEKNEITHNYVDDGSLFGPLSLVEEIDQNPSKKLISNDVKIVHELRLPKRVLTSLSQSLGFFENLDDDENLCFDPILQKVEENKINMLAAIRTPIQIPDLAHQAFEEKELTLSEAVKEVCFSNYKNYLVLTRSVEGTTTFRQDLKNYFKKITFCCLYSLIGMLQIGFTLMVFFVHSLPYLIIPVRYYFFYQLSHFHILFLLKF